VWSPRPSRSWGLIDPLSEVVTPREATRYYPRDHRGRKVHVSTVFRHMKVGVRGVLLESIRTPRLCTSKEAIARFFRKLSEGPGSDSRAKPVVDRVSDCRVEAELDRLGI